MAHRLKRSSIFIALVCVMGVLSISLPSHASTTGGGGGGGDTAWGSVETAGGHSNGATGGGSGPLSGYGALRFTGAVPKIIDGQYQNGCHPDGSDKKFMRAEGYSDFVIDSKDYSIFYLHYRTFVLDSDTNIQMAGAPGLPLWDTGFNANTAQPVAGVPEKKAGKGPKIDPIFGPHWENGNEYCLPLSMEAPFMASLTATAPAVTLTPNIAASGGTGKAIVGMKKATIKLDGTDECRLQGTVAICMKYEGSLIGTTEYLPNGTTKEYNLFSSRPPIRISGVDKDSDPDNGISEYGLSFKKKGNYSMNILSFYTATVWIISTGQIVNVPDLTTVTNVPQFPVISVKSVGRK